MRFFSIIIICLLLVPTTFAFVSADVEERNAVGRLVGETPYAVMHQLDVDELNLNHATYMDDFEYEWNEDIDADIHNHEFSPIRDRFDNYEIYSHFNATENWLYADFNTYLDDFEANELIVIKATGGRNYSSSFFSYDPIEFKDMHEWKSTFMSTYPLFFYNTPYGGVSLPGTVTPISQLTRYSTIIAPTTNEASEEVLRAFICNLGEAPTLGESWTRSRHYFRANHRPQGFWNVRTIDTLMASQYYILYGNPMTEITLPHKADSSEFKRYCERWIDWTDRSGITISSFGVQTTEKTMVETINVNHTVVDIDNGTFSLIHLSGEPNQFMSDELALPVIVRQYDFPTKTILKNPSVNFLNPLVINLSAMAMWENNNLTYRTCYAEQQNESYDAEISYGPSYKTQSISINPIRVMNCSAGLVTLYQDVQINLPYVPHSPVYFKHIDRPDMMLPGGEANVTIQFDYVDNPVLDGEFELLQDDKLVYQTELNSSIDNVTVIIDAPSDEGVTGYVVRYVKNNETLTETRFEVEHRLLAHYLEVPDIVGTAPIIPLRIYNYGAAIVNVTVYDNLIHNGTKVSGGDAWHLVTPGWNNISLSYAGLLQSDEQYALKVDLMYEDYKPTLSSLVVTNHRPEIAPIGNIQVRETELVQFNVTAIDADNDALTVTISAPVGDDGQWQTAMGNMGNYTVNVTVDDGFVSVVRPVHIEVLPFNRMPVLQAISAINVTEGDVVGVVISAYDPDQDELVFGIYGPGNFSEKSPGWFTWKTTYGDAGTYNVSYWVNDGFSAVNGSFSLVVNVAPDPCFNMTCGTYCGGTANSSYFYNGACVEGLCEYENVTLNATQCGAPTQCSDGVDNDNDTFIDYPADPGCVNATDDNETDAIPACSDGVDNDGDGAIDYLADFGCDSAGDLDEVNNNLFECSDGIDNDFDALIDQNDPGCTAFSDDNETDAPPVTQCNDGVDNDLDGFVDFPADLGCVNATDDNETDPIVPTECNDGLDNDGDALIDFPNDPGCIDAGDDDETDPTITECNDGVDNDGDALIDYPADPDCASGLDDSEFDPNPSTFLLNTSFTTNCTSYSNKGVRAFLNPPVGSGNIRCAQSEQINTLYCADEVPNAYPIIELKSICARDTDEDYTTDWIRNEDTGQDCQLIYNNVEEGTRRYYCGAGDVCTANACGDYCAGTTKYSSDSCTAGVCSYGNVELNSTDCGYVAPAVSCPVMFRTNAIDGEFNASTWIAFERTHASDPYVGSLMGAGFTSCNTNQFLSGSYGWQYDLVNRSIFMGTFTMNAVTQDYTIWAVNPMAHVADQVFATACNFRSTTANSAILDDAPLEPYTSGYQEVYTPAGINCPDLEKQGGMFCTVDSECAADLCINNTCVSTCGNGIPEAGEQCDDNNTANGDGCSDVCQMEILSQCSDMLDNDGDGFVDFPADPGCVNATDDNETDVCVTPIAGMIISTSTMLCPGTYYGADITIIADDVDLDCNGAQLKSTNTTINVIGNLDMAYWMNATDNLQNASVILDDIDAFVASMSMIDNVTVHDCFIENAQTAMNLTAISNAELYNNTIIGVDTGIWMIGADNTVRDSTIHAPGTEKMSGAIVGLGKNLNATSNTVIANNVGIGFAGDQNFIGYNNIEQAKYTAGLIGSQGTIRNNDIYNSSEHGIVVFLAKDMLIKNNYVELSAMSGIGLVDSDNITVMFNDLNENHVGIGVSGLFTKGTGTFSIRNNTVTDSLESGIVLNDVWLGFIIESITKNPERDGFNVVNSVVHGNFLDNAGVWDIILKDQGTVMDIVNNYITGNEVRGRGIQDDGADNVYCLAGTGNIYVNNATGPTCADLCVDVTCADYCEDGVYYSGGMCNAGMCGYTNMSLGEPGCAPPPMGEITCSDDWQCGIIDPYFTCNGTTQIVHDGSIACILPGTEDSYCNTTMTQTEYENSTACGYAPVCDVTDQQTDLSNAANGYSYNGQTFTTGDVTNIAGFETGAVLTYYNIDNCSITNNVIYLYSNESKIQLLGTFDAVERVDDGIDTVFITYNATPVTVTPYTQYYFEINASAQTSLCKAAYFSTTDYIGGEFNGDPSKDLYFKTFTDACI